MTITSDANSNPKPGQVDDDEVERRKIASDADSKSNPGARTAS
mgnify:CR=1 FL=1